MRICQLMLSEGLGGAERYFVDLSIALAERGHEVLSVCRRGSVAARHLHAAEAVSVTELNLLGAWDPLVVRRVRRVIAAFQPQVVQAHLARGALIAGKALRGSGIPLTVKTHNYVNLKYYRDVDVIIPTTADQERYLLSAGVDETRVERIANFSNVAAMTSVPPQTTDHRLVSVGRLVHKKGYHVLLEALAKVVQQGHTVELSIAGDGPERESLHRLMRSLGLEQSVRLAGWKDDISAFLRGADVFVLPSLDEPFGIVALEAMASGIPIVSTRSQGPSEVLDESCAYLVETGNAQALADGLMCAMSRRGERLEKAAQALQLFKTEYAREAIVPRLEGLYERLAAAPRSTRADVQ